MTLGTGFFVLFGIGQQALSDVLEMVKLFLDLNLVGEITYNHDDII
jgi:hypothetical protein